MFRKTFTIMILAVLTLTAFQFQSTQAQTGNNTQSIEKVRAKVQEIGTDGKTRVQIKLTNNTRIKGHISAVSTDTFTLTNSDTGAVQTLNYDEVREIKKKGGISKLTWGIIAGATVATVIVWATVIHPVLCDGC